MDIRLLSSADSLTYQQLVHRAYAPTLDLGIHFAAATADLDAVKVHLQTNLVYGLFIEHQLACTASLRLPWGNNPSPFGLPHLGWVATAPEYKKQGLAVKLLNWLEQLLVNQFHCPVLTLGTAENHPWLNQFYQAQGFELIGKTRLSADHITLYYAKILDQTLFALWQQYNPNHQLLSKFQ